MAMGRIAVRFVGACAAAALVGGCAEHGWGREADDDLDFGSGSGPDPFCGNGVVEEGETCDDGRNDGRYGGCMPGCEAVGPHCGDYLINGPEACDDGNAVSGDGCSADCSRDEDCGNGVIDPGEACDDGNTEEGDDCSADCSVDHRCGNGVFRGGGSVVDAEDLEGLGGYTSVTGDLLVEHTGFPDLNHLGCLEQVGGNLVLADNDALTDLDGLGSLAEITGDLRISGNRRVADLESLGSLSFVGGDLVVADNPLLPTCNAEALLDRVSISGDAVICGNLEDGCGSGPCQ